MENKEIEKTTIKEEEIKQENSFDKLVKINLSGHIKSKGGLNYLSWAYAWKTLKENYPDASYHIYSREIPMHREKVITSTDERGKQITETSSWDETREVLYFTDGRTCHVKVGVTVDGVEYVEYLPIMDNRNNAVMEVQVTSTMVNKAIQRAFVKACARHGLGLYIYDGQDEPEPDENDPEYIKFTELKQKVFDGAAKILNTNDSNSPVVMDLTALIRNAIPCRISDTTMGDMKGLEKIMQFLDKVNNGQ